MLFKEELITVVGKEGDPFFNGGPGFKKNAYFPRPLVSLIHEHYQSLLSPSPHSPYRRKKVRKRAAHVRTKNILSAEKHKLSK